MPDHRDKTSSPTPGPGRILSRKDEPGPATGTVAVSGGSAAMLQRLFAGIGQPESLLAAFAHGMATLPGELGDMGVRLQSAHGDADWERYGRLLRLLIDKYIRTIELDAPGTPGGDAPRLRDLLRHTLGVALASLLQDSPELQRETQQVVAALRDWHPGRPLETIEQRLRELCHQVGVRSDGLQEQRDLLLSLFDLLLDNIGELLDDSSWLQGQIAAVRELLGGPLDAASVEQTRGNLREVIYKQGLLKQGIVESKAAMKELMVDFVERVDGMAISTGEYHDRIAGYSLAVRQARSIADLNQLLQDVLQDTGRVQEQALRMRDHLASARAEAEAAEQRIQLLEQQLQEVSGLVRTDPLTGALNRRGFDELLEREMARAARTRTPLCVTLLDLDDFHRTNDSHGHAGGDRALHHLVTVARGQLRSSDSIARLGGDEFVLLLPETPRSEALAITQRLQRAMAQRPFLHEDVRVYVSFSAGTAQWREPEAAGALLQRADRAMYAAKRVGKNRVLAAE
ncbi:diguanylate cyclase [Flavobacterium sp. MXW15]|uniref:diguanylate cyclase n=1 Tax=Xanthomonas chitinilytica TaxID=2989819 RepID=A0ABT3JWK3_9XANT|nr:diguanylate cyclase [Xanthomonas sp. H13-6]MCW4455654.1 diguanylate cyclase [Flavobacterium sp. MXW15]MCW4472860.1 diguanylate cyclase [Xanthomonas sp. H13-6]